MKEILNRLNKNPTYEDYRECRYQLISLAENIAIIDIEIASKKEELKIKEAERVAELKSDGVKRTIKDIESIITQETKNQKQEIINLQAENTKNKARYEAVDKFLKAVDSSLYYLNNQKNDI